MLRSASALLLAAALALPGAPARADLGGLDGNQAAQIVGGLLALYGIKEALEDRDDRKDRAAPVQRYQTHRPQADHAPRRHYQRHDGHGRYDTPNRWPHRDARVAPRRCERPFRDRHGWSVGYGARCMWRSVDRPRLLPDACLREVETPRGTRQVYPRNCLRRAGWTFTAGR